MNTNTRTIRIFVSSTFSDLLLERDELQDNVFPRLKQLCLSKGLRFQAIDLRWGISEEAGLDNRTMRICLRELERCQRDRPKPNFFVLLGDRYGWRPLPELIPSSLYEELSAQIATVDPSAAELLRQSYALDENAVPPTYELKSQGARTNWNHDVERPLLAALEQAAQQLPSELRASDVAIGTSATEQEIAAGALTVEHASRHVRAMIRVIDGLPPQPQANYVEGGELGQRLTRLKDRLRTTIGDANLRHYHVPWHGDRVRRADLNEFSRLAWELLRDVIEQQTDDLASVDPLAQEEIAHREFGRERCRHFVGRTETVQRILESLRDHSGRRMVVVVGPPGAGKSAMMAKVAEDCRNEMSGAGQTPEVVARYIAATPASSDLIQLLRTLIAEIRRRYPIAADGPGPVDANLPVDRDSLSVMLHEAFERASAERPLRVFLDALDQLSASHDAHALGWLPRTLPPDVLLVVSAKSSAPVGGSQVAETLLRHASGAHVVRLSAMSDSEGGEMLDHWLADAHRRLQPAQREAVLVAFQAEGSPLWLRAAAEEATGWRSWSPVPVLPPTTPGLLEHVIRRLSSEHGALLVARTLDYLACARFGLAEDELLDILSRDTEVMEEFRHRSSKSQAVDRLPVAVWVRLQGDLDFYLAEHYVHGASLLGFYHRSFLEAAMDREHFLTRDERVRHQQLAAYFGSLKLALEAVDDAGQPFYDRRRLGEQAWQLRLAMEKADGDEERASTWHQLYSTVTDPDWVRAVVGSGLAEELVDDYVCLHAIAGQRGTKEEQERVVAALLDYLRNERGRIGLPALSLGNVRAWITYRLDKSLWEGLLHTVLLSEPSSEDVAARLFYAKCSIQKGAILRRENRLDEAQARIEAGLELLPGDDHATHALALYEMGYIHFMRGEADSAIDCFERSMVQASDSQDAVRTGIGECVAMNVGFLHGRVTVETFTRMLDRVCTAFEARAGVDADARRWVANAKAHHFDVAVLENDAAQATTWSEQIEQDSWLRAYPGKWPYARMGRLALVQGRFADAVTCFRTFLGDDEEKVGRMEQTSRVYWELGRALDGLGQRAEAITAWRKGCDTCIDDAGNRLWKNRIRELLNAAGANEGASP